MPATEVVGDLGTKKFPNLPFGTNFHTSLVLHNKTILLCGVNWMKCLQLDNGTWKEHSTFNLPRDSSSPIVATKTATFIFGGFSHSCIFTYEYLPKDSTTWLMGKTKIPGGFLEGCAIAVKSEQEIWLIGGIYSRHRVLCFNVNDHTFHELPYQLKARRTDYKAVFIPNTNKILVTGGLAPPEIIDPKEGKVTMANPMHFKRSLHGMGIVTIDGEDRLAVLGGFDGRAKLDSVEFYNVKTEKWETSSIKLKDTKYGFAYLSLKLGDIDIKL